MRFLLLPHRLTSDKPHCVTVAGLDFARLAATRAHSAAALMRESSPGASRPDFVHPLSLDVHFVNPVPVHFGSDRV
jgi:hypothetical protein